MEDIKNPEKTTPSETSDSMCNLMDSMRLEMKRLGTSYGDLIRRAVDSAILENSKHPPADGRTYRLETKVRPDFYSRLKKIATRDELKVAEVIERAIDLYEAERSTP